MANAGAENKADYLTIVCWITNYENQMMDLGKRFDAFLQELVDEKRDEKEEKRHTMIHHLLSLQKSQPGYYTDEIIKGIILVSISRSQHFFFFFKSVTRQCPKSYSSTSYYKSKWIL